MDHIEQATAAPGEQRAVRVAPGETLIIEAPSGLRPWQIDDIKTGLEAELLGVKVVVLVGLRVGAVVE